MKKNIGVFFGGCSVEHEVSIISALQVIKNIDKNKYNVVPVYISQDGVWYTNKYYWLTQIESFRNLKYTLQQCTKVLPSLNANDGLLWSYPKGLFNSSKKLVKLDVAFPVFHGAYGEDGCFQGIFEAMNIPYVGSDVVSSAVCMDKTLTKQICEAIRIPVVEYCRIDADLWAKDKAGCLAKIKKSLAFPLIVKPNDLGSSIGVSKANNETELENAVDVVTAYSNEILIERCVTNIREINCSVAETEKGILVSECEEPIVISDNLLTFSEKYLSESTTSSEGMASTKRKIPAEISGTVKNKIQEHAVKIFKHLGCSGVVRIDFILEGKSIYLNEINTIPGSLAFYLWEATDKNFETLISELIENSVKRFIKKGKLRKDFISNILTNAGGKLGDKLSAKLG